MKPMNTYFVILAGGKGERLWPLSRNDKPKQLLPFLDNQSLLEQTISRIQKISIKQNIWIITTEEQLPQINVLVGNQVGKIIAEPTSKNTAPALLLASLMIEANDPQAMIVFLPADHYILDNDDFCNTVAHAVTISQAQQAITLIGVTPQGPATGYGYIEYNQSLNNMNGIIQFHEKPDLETAQKYYKTPGMLWNIGIFCAQSNTFIAQCKTHAIDIYNRVTAYIHTGNKQEYELITATSIDYAVIEKSKNLYVVIGTFKWSDVGNLDTFLSLQRQNVSLNTTVALNSDNNILNVKNKLVALINVNNICIIETDDVLLIVPRAEVEQVKVLLQHIKNNKLEQYL